MTTDERFRLAHCLAFLDDLSAEKALVQALIDANQQHLFCDWDKPGINDESKRRFITQLKAADAAYPGGLAAYLKNAQRLLAEMQSESNPFDQWTPTQPETVDLTQIDTAYRQYEDLAVEALDKIAVVLVAGGLGERLGYPGIKLDIPVEVTQNTSYLEHYCRVLKAMEARMPEPRPVPFIIMTSQQTHEKTVASLERNAWFGLDSNQFMLLKQDLVPAIADNEGRLCLKDGDRYQLNLKPHGHGDVHMLLHRRAVKKLQALGIEHLLFIQDTNGQAFNAAFAAIGVAIQHGFDFNSVAVSRIPREACGALVKLTKQNEAQTLNVEYHVLDQLLRDAGYPDGDAPDEHGHSLFPGNINILTARLESYCRVLDESGGMVPEFVNPKYKDASRTEFKKPTRLETLMQDLPRLFKNNEKVGVTVFDRRWCFSADKNSVETANQKIEENGPPESAASAENDFYHAGREKCRLAGMEVTEAPTEPILGIPFTRGPRVVLRPSFALSVDEVKSKIAGGRISDEATLILDGRDIRLENVELAGQSALVIKAVDGAHVLIKDMTVQNDGFQLIPLSDAELARDDTPEYIKIRGYRIEDVGARILEFTKPGDYVVSDETSR